MGIFPGLEYDNVVVINHPNPERRCRNELYGVDCHISTLDFEVVDGKGAIKKKACVNNGAKEFMEFVKSIPKPRKIFIEEGELASWLLETSLRFGEQLIIIDPRGNKWISKAKQKNDSVDATKIAQLIVEDIKADLEKSGASVKVGTIVLIHTGRDKYMGTKDYWLKGTGMSAAATEWLIDQGVGSTGKGCGDFGGLGFHLLKAFHGDDSPLYRKIICLSFQVITNVSFGG